MHFLGWWRGLKYGSKSKWGKTETLKPYLMASGQRWKCKLLSQSCPTLCDPMDPLVHIAHQAPLSTEFSRQEYRSGLPCPFLGYLPDPGIEPRSPTLQADCLPSEPPGQKVGSIKISVWYWQCRKELRRRKEKVEPLNKSVGEKIWKSHEFLTSGQLQRAAWG